MVDYGGIGQGALRALQAGQASFSNQLNTNRQREQLSIQREQQDIQNEAAAVIQRKDDAKQLVGAIHGHLKDKGYSDWSTVPAAELLTDRPELVLGMLNDAQTNEYRKFENEKGELVGSTIVEMRKNQDNTFTPMVKRGDTGEVVPMTVGRNTDPNGKIQTITAGELQSQVNSRYQAATGDGGLENTNSLLAGADATIAYEARKQALDLGVEKLREQGADQSQLTQFGGLVNGIDLQSETAKDDLLKILASVGGDAEAVQAEGQARADALFAEKEAAYGPQTEFGRTINPTGTEAVGPNTQDRMDLNGITDRRELDFISDMQKTIAGSDIGKMGNKSGYFRKQSEADYDANSAAETFYGKNETAIGKALYRNSDLKAEFDELGPKDFATKYKDVDLKTLIPAGPAQTMSIATAPTFALTPENIKQAIMTQTENPTAEQKSQISAFLTSKGVKTEADLTAALKAQEINEQDGQMIAWVMGATHSGNTAQKAALAQKLTNGIVRGDQEVGLYQQAQLEGSRAQGAAATRNAQTNYMKAMQESRKYDQEAVGNMLEVGEKALNEVYTQLGLLDEDGKETGDNFDGDEDDAKFISRKIMAFIPRLKSAQGPVSGQAGMDFLNPMLSLYLQAQANADKASLFNSETYADFFRKNPDGNTDFDLQNVQFGKVVNGKPVSLVYMDQAGVRSQEVPIRTIQKDNKVIAKLLVTAAAANKAFTGSQTD